MSHRAVILDDLMGLIDYASSHGFDPASAILIEALGRVAATLDARPRQMAHGKVVPLFGPKRL